VGSERMSMFWPLPMGVSASTAVSPADREFFIDSLLVRVHFIIVIIRWTSLAPHVSPAEPLGLQGYLAHKKQPPP